MRELSLNVMDVAQNSVRADASLISITVNESKEKDLLSIVIEDDGCGMTEEQVQNVTDPFFTTRTTEKSVWVFRFLNLHVSKRAEASLSNQKSTAVQKLLQTSLCLLLIWCLWVISTQRFPYS